MSSRALCLAALAACVTVKPPTQQEEGTSGKTIVSGSYSCQNGSSQQTISYYILVPASLWHSGMTYADAEQLLGENQSQALAGFSLSAPQDPAKPFVFEGGPPPPKQINDAPCPGPSTSSACDGFNSSNGLLAQADGLVFFSGPETARTYTFLSCQLVTSFVAKNAAARDNPSLLLSQVPQTQIVHFTGTHTMMNGRVEFHVTGVQ